MSAARPKLFGMRVVGVDPGLAACGYGVVETDGSKVRVLAFGCWQTEASSRVELRLRELFVSLAALLERYRPDLVALEESFVGPDARSALSVGQVRGTLLGRLRQDRFPVCRVLALPGEAGRLRLRTGGQGAGAADGQGAARARADTDPHARG
jgi:crossover junction endodeoxyribonuclease RuvC